MSGLKTAVKPILLFAVLCGLLLIPCQFGLIQEKTNTALAEKQPEKSSSRAGASQKKSLEPLPVKVTGDEDCKEQTAAALGELKEKSLADYEKVAANIGIIECSNEGSGIFAWEKPARFKAGLATRQTDVSWYASVLVHESCHVDQHQNGFRIGPKNSAQDKILSEQEAEIQCLNLQHEVLARLGASQQVLDYLEDASGSDYWDVTLANRWW